MVSHFAQQVYDVLRERVPAGKVTTYKALAESLDTRAYRAIGQVMNKNPYGFFGSHNKKVPCHRVISSDGSLGGFAVGVQAKKDLLINEGIIFENGKVKESQILRTL